MKTAVILAAGMGSRVQDIFPELPKGLISIGGTSLIERSVRLLEAHGITRIIIVSGFHGELYHKFARYHASVEVVDNPAYATTGTMASLACALERVDTDFLLLESDLVYETRALAAILADSRPDVILTSGPTGATDEVWVDAVSGRLRSMSKDHAALDSVAGEFVGITRVSKPLSELLLGAYQDTSEQYEVHGLVAAARSREIGVRCVPDLIWGEIDCALHYHRVLTEVWPALL